MSFVCLRTDVAANPAWNAQPVRLSQVWSGVIVSPDSVHQAVASLRRQLGDDPKQPIYIGDSTAARVSDGGDRQSLGGSVQGTSDAGDIAVLPFLDRINKMSHEIFADGMTEELIDKLSKIPGLRVPAPRSPFDLKGQRMPIAEIAKTLGVVYVLDGSVRKSGATVRVAARLIRAESGPSSGLKPMTGHGTTS
jgi:transcriptional activator of cad operon